MTTRRVTISSTKAANAGPAYTDQFLGLPVAVQTYEGDTLLGTVEDVRTDGVVVRFPDGRWMRRGYDLAVVVGG